MAATVATAFSSSSGPRPKLTDFLLRWAKPKRQTGEEQRSVFQALAAQMQPKD